MMKKNKVLLVLGCLSLGIGGISAAHAVSAPIKEAAATVTAGTYTYDLVTNFGTYASGWGSSYGAHTIASADLGTGLPAASIVFAATNKQSNTITTMPVSKDSADSFTLSESGFVITSVEVVVSQWTTKVPTIYVKEAGAANNNYSGAAGLTSKGPTATEGTTGVITFTGTSVTSFDFGNTSSNQIGWKSIKVTIAAAASFGTLSSISVLNPADTLAFEVGETFASTGLTLTATDTANVAKTVTSGFTTDYDAHVFVAVDIGTKTVTISYTEGSVTKTATYVITVTAAPVYTNVFNSAANCFPDDYKAAGNVAAGKYDSYKALSGLGWDFAADFGTSTTVAVQCNSGLVVGINATPCSSFTLTSDIFGVNDNYAISKIVMNIKGNSGLAATLDCKVGGAAFGTQSQTVPAAATEDLTFSSETPAYGQAQFIFAATTAKGLTINNIRIYAAAGSGDTHDAYAFAKKVEAADGCAANSALATEYNGLSSSVKTIADAITFNDYATSAIKTATIPYKGLNVTVAQKMAAIVSLNAGGSARPIANANTNSSDVLVYSLLAASALAVGSFFIFRKKKHA